MEWFVILALGVGLWVEHRRVAALDEELAKLRQAFDGLAKRVTREPEPALAVVEQPPAPPAVEPHLPIPREILEPENAAPGLVLATVPQADPAPARPPSPPLSEWLAEHGLAWIGGGALALGGLFLVAYAAQEGVFTPPWRIGAAVVLGASMLAVGEVIRRGRLTGLHPLAAAMASGAGAATLYGAVWASQALYGFIGVPEAAVLLAAVSLSLLGLALLHGEALALLALAGADIAPLVNRPERWSGAVLTFYLLLILATGLAAAVQRRWSRAALVVVAGAAAWGLSSLTGPAEWRTMTMLLAPVIGALLAAEVAARRPDVGDSLAAPLELAFAAASILSVGFWCAQAAGAFAHSAPSGQTGPGLTSAMLAALAGLGARRGRLSDRMFALVAMTVVASGVVLLVQGRVSLVPADPGWSLAAVAVLAAAGLASGSARAAKTAAVGAAVLIGLVRLSGSAAADWRQAIAPAVGGLGLLAGAAWLARRTPDPAQDPTTGVWVGASAAAGLLAIQALSHAGAARWEALAFAAFALALSAFALRPGWRGFAGSAVAGALCALGTLLGPVATGVMETGSAAALPPLILSGFGTALLLFAGQRLLGRRGEASAAATEALWTASLIAGLTGAFLLLRTVALPHGANPAPLDGLTEASLRTLLLLVAGLLAQGRATGSRWNRWRGPGLAGGGLLHGLLFQGLLLNPVWSGYPIAGPPLLDALVPAFLAPAAVLAAIARRPSALRKPLAVAALAAGLLWVGIELRRLFHGPDLGSSGASTPEIAAYALAGLAVAVLLLTLSRRRPALGVARTARGAAWTALALGLGLFGWGASPWWGPIAAPLRSVVEAIGLLALYAAGVCALITLARGWRERPTLGPALRIGAAAVAFALLSLMVRFAFRGVQMREALQEASLETWAFSAVWAAYGLGLLVLGARGRDGAVRGAALAVLLGTTAKVLVFDMARLEGVVRAGSFLALGALLLAGAVAARRLAGARREPSA